MIHFKLISDMFSAKRVRANIPRIGFHEMRSLNCSSNCASFSLVVFLCVVFNVAKGMLLSRKLCSRSDVASARAFNQLRVQDACRVNGVSKDDKRPPQTRNSHTPATEMKDFSNRIERSPLMESSMTFLYETWPINCSVADDWDQCSLYQGRS